MNLSDRIDNIELKVRQLILKIERLQNENVALEEKNKQLKADLDRQKGTVDALKNKLEFTQRVMDQQKEEESDDSKHLKEKIDHYIREIDKCIEWLQTN